MPICAMNSFTAASGMRTVVMRLKRSPRAWGAAIRCGPGWGTGAQHGCRGSVKAYQIVACHDIKFGGGAQQPSRVALDRCTTGARPGGCIHRVSAGVTMQLQASKRLGRSHCATSQYSFCEAGRDRSTGPVKGPGKRFSRWDNTRTKQSKHAIRGSNGCGGSSPPITICPGWGGWYSFDHPRRVHCTGHVNVGFGCVVCLGKQGPARAI